MNNFLSRKDNLRMVAKPLTSVRAFTIIELLVVMAIIAVLSLVVVANAGDARAKGRDAKRVSDIASIQLALTGFYNKCGQYPYGEEITEFSGGNGKVYLTVTSECPSDPSIKLGQFMNRIPYDPSTDMPYEYVFITDRSSLVVDYHLAAVLELPNAALKDRANFNSTALDGVEYFVFGGPDFPNISGIDATSNDLIYDVRPGI